MSRKDVQDYLEIGMYGTPQLKPDEQRKYLGTFRERVFFAMTIAEMRNKKNLRHFKEELKRNPNHQLLLNAAVGFSIQNDYMLAAQKLQCEFKIVDTDNQSHAEAIGLVYATDHAVDVEQIMITERTSQSAKPITPSTVNTAPTPQKKKESWFGKLFK